ncbi:DUF2914 domain-containing protein [Accumulibacter sp.]|uniref:DUF2914 domain-containing protein n=1 Tax=Accumulibacter sp. TaxID=2053492 RepID=UPI0026390259|nr:DUF2914 domain-containing protein [Accumulibacter sp.]
MNALPAWVLLRRLYPVAAFLAGFVWDALTIGQRIRVVDFWRLGAFLLGAALLTLWLARREALGLTPPEPDRSFAGRCGALAWQAPYLLLQFFFGGIFSALFILYFKSSGHLGTWLMAAFLGALLVGNEFAGERYGRRFTLTWALFALNAILLFNFALPHALGSLDPLWFYASTAAGVVLTVGLRWLAPRRPGRIAPAWGLAAILMLAFSFDMIAPVPLVKRQLAVGLDFVQERGRYAMQVERPAWWQWWRDQASTVHVPEGGRLYGLSAVFAPLGVTAALEHRWEILDSGGWRVVYRRPFQSTGGRDRGFRGYSWVLNPPPGDWRFIVATQDGRTIDILRIRVERGTPKRDKLLDRNFD